MLLGDGSSHEATPSLVVGADGRFSSVRRAAGIELHSAPIRQYMTGLLVESARPLSSHIDSADLLEAASQRMLAA